MSVEVAEKAGFCFGVDRAVKMAYEQVARGERVFTYGQLIHNRDVTDDLQSKGVGCIENLDEVRAGDIVIIRAHGVSKKEMDILEGKGAKVVDAEVPLSEMFGYATDLRSRTQGRGQFTMQFDHYSEVPKSVAEKVIGERAKK